MEEYTPSMEAPMHRLVAFAVLALLSSPIVAWSQNDVDIVAGSRLRVTERESKHDHHLGTVVAMSADSVVVRLDESGKRAPFAWAGLSQIDVSRGNHGHAAAGVGIGLLGGAGIGALIGAISTQRSSDNLEKAMNTLAWSGIGAVVGMIAGGIIGANHKTEKWTEVEVESISISAGASCDGGVALILGVHF
jgi:hypothetical protein